MPKCLVLLISIRRFPSLRISCRFRKRCACMTYLSPMTMPCSAHSPARTCTSATSFTGAAGASRPFGRRNGTHNAASSWSTCIALPFMQGSYCGFFSLSTSAHRHYWMTDLSLLAQSMLTSERRSIWSWSLILSWTRAEVSPRIPHHYQNNTPHIAPPI